MDIHIIKRLANALPKFKVGIEGGKGTALTRRNAEALKFRILADFSLGRSNTRFETTY